MASLYDDLYSAPATVESAKTSLLDDLGLEPAEGLGITGTLKEGAKSAGRAIGAAANAYTGDNQGIVDKAEAQQQAPKDYRLDKFYGDFADRTAALGDNPGVLETIGEGAGAIWDNPAGAGLAVVEQLPNAMPALAGGFAGMKAGAAGGAALGSVVAPGPGTAVGGAVGGVVGGLAGMFLGNTAIETGHKAMAMADDGAVTDAERSQAISEGAIKGGVITGVDALTLGAGGKLASALQRTTSSAMESATRKVLIDRGVDVADNAAVLAARGNPEIATAVRAAQESARQVTDKFGKRLAVGGTLLGMETVGEGVGEYLGELAATGEGNVPDAVLESLLSLGQSGAETAWNMARKSPSQGLWVQPQPSASNPAPAPIAAPNPEDGVLSRSVLAALPAPAPRLGLPAPESVLYADGQGTVSDQGPARNVDREYRPTGRERDPRTFGAGMDQQTERGAVPGREGDYIPVSRFASQQVLASNTIDGQLAPEPRGLPAPQRLLADGRADAGFIETNAAGESRQAKAGNVPPRDYVPQGGRGMDQQTPVGKKYTGMPAARKALRESANPAAMEVVKVGKKLFEVRAKPVDGGASEPVTAPSTVQFAAGQRWQHQGRTYNVNKVQADGRASVTTPSGSQAFVIRPEQAAAEGWTQDAESNGSPLSANGTPVTAQPAQKKARKVDRERDSVAHAVIRLGGITTNYRQDTTGEAKGNTNIPGVGSLWSDKTGTSIDDMASLLDQHGYIPQGEMASDGGVSWLQAALGDQLAGRKEHFAPGSKRQEEQALKIEADRAAARAAQYTDRDAEIDALIDANFDLADDTEAAEKRRIATEKFAAELDELFGDSNEPASTQESVTGAEQSYDQAAGADQSVDRRDGSEQRDQGEGVAAAGSADSAPAFDLAAQTEASAAADAKAQDERNKADAAAQRKADEAKKKADDLAYIKQQSQATADNFTLGQNAEDSVTGQGGMFDSRPSLTELGGKPGETEKATADNQDAIDSLERQADEAYSRYHNGSRDQNGMLRKLSRAESLQADRDSLESSRLRLEANRLRGILKPGNIQESNYELKKKRFEERERNYQQWLEDQAGQMTVADELASMDLDALAALIDDVANESAAAQTSKPKAKRSAKAKTADGKPRLRPTKSKAERTDIAQPAEVSRAAGEIAKSLGVNMSKAGLSALEGLTQLFGGPGRLSSGLSFDEETYAKAKPHFAAAMTDIQAAGKDLRDFIRALMSAFGDGVKPYILRYAQDLKQEQDGERTDAGVEPDSAQDEQPGDGRDVFNQGPEGSRQGDRSVVDGGRGQRAGSDDGVSDGRSTADGERGDRQVDGEQPAVETSSAGNPDGSRSGGASTGGLYAERDTNQAADRAVEQAVAPSKANVKASNSPATLEEIKQQLPFLTEGQAEDVVFAEKRLMKPDGYGVLYTNGTGTGKTFTGIGVMARSAARGKDNILVVAPKQTIVDAWVKAAKSFFGLDIVALKDTNDNGGSGIVATTYANLAANNSLALRDWDMVVADEAHYLSSAEDGANTGALTNLRALTMRRGFARELVRMQNPDMVEAIERLNVEAKAARVEENNALSDRLQAQASAIHGQLDELTKSKAAEIAAIAPADKPRAVFLSATPFAYEKNVSWAQEFLFDWGVAEDGDGQAYNSGGLFERFMMQHFGYRMRYNKLTAPDAKVDSGLMQRAFNSWLRREGALSARALDSNFDYDRLFVTVDSQIGRRVDDALKWLWNMSSGRDLSGNDVNMSDDERAAYGAVNERISKDNFNYHARMYFLEAIKAREALPHIRAQLAAGRKVLVMHDFKKGGVVNPFRQTFAEAAEQKAYEHFASDFSDLIRAFSSLPSPIDQLTRAFPDALVYNGSVPAKLRIAMQNNFNSDEDGSPHVIIAQGDAMREGVSIHDTSGKFPRVLVHLGMPVKPTASIQQEGRIYRTGQASNALFRYFTIGTSWERSAFASKIAARAGAAENLAMGEQARGLKQAFIDAYENADLYAPGFDGEGLGGKAADRAAAAALTPWDMAKSYYFGTKKQGAGRAARGREGNDYFATPEPVGLKMVEWADIRGGDSVLEPSAGHGAIARWFPDNSTVRVIEDSAELASRVALHVDGDVVHGRFEDHNIVNKYDAIVMNPPYGLGGSVAIPHLAKAADHLRSGGRVVALIPTGPAADKKFDNWFYGQDKNGNSLHPDLHLVGDVKMPSVTFERAGTAVATRVVIIERVGKDEAEQMQPARTADLSSITDIGELFTRMESMEMRARVKPIEEEAEQTAPAKSVEPKQTYAQKAAAKLGEKYVTDLPIVEHVTKGGAGKTLRGVIVTDMTLAEVKEKLDKFAFKKDGGVFVRADYIQRPDADDPRFSSGATGATLTTLGRGDVEQITARLVTEAAVARRFVFSSWEELPQAIKDRAAAQGAKPGEIKAVHWQGKTYLVDRRFMDAGDVERTIFHEYYAHYGLRQQYGKDLHRKLLRTWAKVGGTKGVRAMAAEQGFNIDHYIEGAKQDKELTEAQRRVLVMDELLAHMAESTGSLKRLIQEWYGAVRDWLRGNGWAELAKLNAADLAFMLREARQAALRADGGSVSGQPLFRRVESAKQISTVAFKRWFGESKVVDKQGAPKILYHGTGEDFTSFDQGRSGSSTRHSTAPLGIFMTGDRDTAQAYADKASDGMPGYARVMQLYAAIRNPYLMSVAESQAIDSPGEAVAFRAKLEREGYDGISLKGTDTWIAFSNTQMKSATDNNGEFDEWSGDIRFRRSARDLFDRATGPAPLDRNDPFAAENRRLREDDKTLWAKAKKVFARQFAPGGLLPDAVFAEKITRDSEFQAVEFDVRHLSGGLNQAVKADFGVDLDNLTPEQMKPLAEALTGKVDPSIPEATRVAIVAMRQYIDSLSGEYLSILQKQVELNMEGADQALIDKITGNLGAYVNRSYQAFDDPKWFKTVPTETVNAARTYLAKGYMEQGETPAEAARLADVTVNEMLKNGTAYDSMGGFIAESKLGAKDLTVLIKRKDIAPEIRALLGEYMDPRLNFAKSATKMGRMVWNQRFLDRVLEFGMGTLFFKGKDRPADATTQIAGEQSESYAPLNGLWTFPEVAQSFQDALGKEQMSDLYRTVVRLNGMVKYGKTILSPTTAMRNWQSAMFFSLANGHFDMSQMKKSWSAFREQVTQNATGDDLAYLRKLKQLGVVYDTPYAGEMMALMDDARMDELLSSKSGTGLKWLRKANQFAQGFYSFGDDFWKIIGYENEKASLIAAGIPEAKAETMAAERIRNTYPTYSMIGKAVQWLRRFPLAGTFVSFPSEIIRTTVNMMKLTAADLKSDNPGIRAIGRKRAAGMAMVSAGFYALSAMTAAALGVGDDEEEALRDLAAPWSKNSTFLYAGRDADGKLRYFDMSFLDPYGYWKRPLTAMMRDQPWEQAAASGIGDMLSPFFGADITAGAIFEVLANKKPTGGQVYNENAGSVDQLQDISNHMRKALQPGFVSNGERLWLAGSDARREGSGQPYDMRDEVVSLLGWRSATLDTQTGLYYRSFDFTDALADAKKTLTRTLRSSNDVSEGDIRESKQAANAQYQKAFTEMGRLISSAGTAGMSRGEIVQTLKLSGVSQRNILALISGRVPPIDIGVHAQSKAVKQARVMRDGEHAAEIARRFRLAREQ